jgi:hypothetical protein
MLFSGKIEVRWLGAFCLIAALTTGSAPAVGADTYALATRQLTISSLSVGNMTLSDVQLVVEPANVIGGPAGTGPVGPIDTYEPVTGLLSLQAVTLGSATDYNILVNINGNTLNAIGSVTGGDTYDGTYLTIPLVQVPGLDGEPAFHTDVVVTNLQNIHIAGGMPTLPWDSYVNNTLTIPVVTFKGKVYTNVTVGSLSVHSVGSLGTAQTITFPAPVPPSGFKVNGEFPLFEWAPLTATASSGLPVTYYSATPSVCRVFTGSVDEQYIAFQYVAPDPPPTGTSFTEAGTFVAGLVPIPGAPANYTVNTVVGTATMVNGVATSAPLGLASQATAYPSSGVAYTGPYPNFVLPPFVFDDVYFLNGNAWFDPAGLLLQTPVPGPGNTLINLGRTSSFGYFYNDSIINPAIAKITPFVPGLNAGFGGANPSTTTSGNGPSMVALSKGACFITAFQSGNAAFAPAPPVTLFISSGEIIIP